MTACFHCIVTGRVQGVFFRAATERKAVDLDLEGWVRNLPDGSVEVLACGDEAAMAKLQEWLWQGPAHARVSEVRCTAVAAPGDLRGFEVR